VEQEQAFRLGTSAPKPKFKVSKPKVDSDPLFSFGQTAMNTTDKKEVKSKLDNSNPAFSV
jgi:hypothetical protein